jgi:ABC-type amino acid transport substrate-binding protein
LSCFLLTALFVPFHAGRLLLNIRPPLPARPAPAATAPAAAKLIVGFDQNFPPYGFVDERANVAGFDIDLAKEKPQAAWAMSWFFSPSTGMPKTWSFHPARLTASERLYHQRREESYEWTDALWTTARSCGARERGHNVL